MTDAYEPGSIFKAVTVSGALSEGLIKPSTKLTLPPSITVGGRTIHEAEARGTESMTVSDIIAYSSNVGAVKIGMLLGQRRLLKWIERLRLRPAHGHRLSRRDRRSGAAALVGVHHR